jgi:hypothetical protein
VTFYQAAAAALRQFNRLSGALRDDALRVLLSSLEAYFERVEPGERALEVARRLGKSLPGYPVMNLLYGLAVERNLLLMVASEDYREALESVGEDPGRVVTYRELLVKICGGGCEPLI